MRLNAPATATAIQLAQNGTSPPFKVTDHPITIRSNCRSATRAKMPAASVQEVLMGIAFSDRREAISFVIGQPSLDRAGRAQNLDGQMVVPQRVPHHRDITPRRRR